MRMRRWTIAMAGMAVVLSAAAVPPTSGDPGQSAEPAPPTPAQLVAAMTLPQQVGQLLMMGMPTDHVDTHLIEALRRYHVGSVVLIGNSTAGVAATARVTGAIHAAADTNVGVLVAVDQEGGAVQHLQGPGFDRMPPALTMGTWPVSRVRASAGRWATQLRRAGVDVDLAPVLDVVPTSKNSTNLPIGSLRREFGHTPARVTRKGGAFAAGLADAGVGYALKHFPGLGRVRGNTDNAAGVTDAVTTRHDADLAPFAEVIGAGAPIVLVSSATYLRIDKRHPAVFSSTVMTGMLRHDLGFDGVIVSDSLSAAQLAARTPSSRALQFVRAGGDLALTTSLSDLPTMYGALLTTARKDPTFRAKVRAAAVRVLRLKERYDLLVAAGRVPDAG